MARAAAAALAAATAAALNPSDFDYCGAPNVSFPTVSPAGYQLAQLHVFTRHGDRTRTFGGPCWPGDDAAYECPLRIALASSDSDSQEVPLPRVFRKTYNPALSPFSSNGLPGTCGLGQLTERGYAQHTANGKALRAAYGAFLPDLNDPAQVGLAVLRSTDVDRTLQSGRALVDAAFPPALPDSSGVAQQLPWVTADMGYDSLVQPSSICPLAGTFEELAAQEPAFAAHVQAQMPLWTALADALNMSSSVAALMNAGDDLDCLMTHVCGGVPTPPALTAGIVSGIVAEAGWEMGFAYGYPNATNAALRANVGFLLSDVVTAVGAVVPAVAAPPRLPAARPVALGDLWQPHAVKAAAGPAPTFLLYSGHDTGPMAPLVAALGLTNPAWPWPRYADVMLLEVWVSPTNSSDAAVRVVYHGEQQALPGCPGTGPDGLCPLPAFLQLAASFMPTAADCLQGSGAGAAPARASRAQPAPLSFRATH